MGTRLLNRKGLCKSRTIKPLQVGQIPLVRSACAKHGIMVGRTTIAIAHRLSTVKDTDVICVLSVGLVLEQGSHNELLQANGAYAGLVQAQKLKAQLQTKRYPLAASILVIILLAKSSSRNAVHRRIRNGKTFRYPSFSFVWVTSVESSGRTMSSELFFQ